jgi:hypothetical protein
MPVIDPSPIRVAPHSVAILTASCMNVRARSGLSRIS